MMLNLRSLSEMASSADKFTIVEYASLEMLEFKSLVSSKMHLKYSSFWFRKCFPLSEPESPKI